MKREVERDLTAAQAMENTTLRQRNQTAILSVLFTMLFRVVKSPTGKSNEVLTATLGGLAKFAHFINIDFFADLVNALHDLTAADDESSALTPLQSVHVVRTVFTLLDGQGSSLNIDPHRFYLLLEKSIPEFDASTKDPDVVFPAILDTLDAALLRRRKTLTKPRVAAFLRVLVKSSLAAPTPAAAAFLLTCKTLLHAHPWAMAYLLEAEEESAGPISVIGTPRTEGASGWDLARLRSSPCEEVQLLANHLSAGCPITGPNTLPGTLGKLSPLDLFQSMSQKVS
ncbi:unnamed protein product [Cyprideis torosa]|uniref:CCAAT-binding factor domain-containing protein n=1 Tax=Cyprideis torosa TaxID=163714 RepID=A0A7R8ZSR7_9CRUS|nr:unnamed protein product [Cyprideis torosa]CAG0896703.1 unnamed protein product [Cyprideis torosa]